MPLDIFGKVMKKYPEFRSIYEEVYEMCRNVEEIMGLFSEELAEKGAAKRGILGLYQQF